MAWDLEADGWSEATDFVASRPAGVALAIILPDSDERAPLVPILRAVQKTRPQAVLPYHESPRPHEIAQVIRRPPVSLASSVTDYMAWRGFSVDPTTRNIIQRTIELSARLSTITDLARNLYVSRARPRPQASQQRPSRSVSLAPHRAPDTRDAQAAEQQGEPLQGGHLAGLPGRLFHEQPDATSLRHPPPAHSGAVRLGMGLRILAGPRAGHRRRHLEGRGFPTLRSRNRHRVLCIRQPAGHQGRRQLSMINTSVSTSHRTDGHTGLLLRLFGGPILIREGSPVKLSPFQSALVAITYGLPATEIPRATVQEHLWGGTGTKAVRHRLSQLVYQTNHRCGATVVSLDGEFVRAHPDVVATDLREFDRLIGAENFKAAASSSNPGSFPRYPRSSSNPVPTGSAASRWPIRPSWRQPHTRAGRTPN